MTEPDRLLRNIYDEMFHLLNAGGNFVEDAEAIKRLLDHDIESYKNYRGWND